MDGWILAKGFDDTITITAVASIVVLQMMSLYQFKASFVHAAISLRDLALLPM